jgi:hypothetical protein
MDEAETGTGAISASHAYLRGSDIVIVVHGDGVYDADAALDDDDDDDDDNQSRRTSMGTTTMSTSIILISSSFHAH